MINPKDKARQIVDRYFELHVGVFSDNLGKAMEHAKQSAELAARLVYHEYAREYEQDEIFWDQVIIEIGKL